MISAFRKAKYRLRRFLCKHNLHSWTKWKEDGLTYVDYRIDDDGFYHHIYTNIARRRCINCKQKQIKDVE